MMKTESHTITSKGYVPLRDPDNYDIDYPLEARNRTSSLSVLTPTGKRSKFKSKFSSRRTQRGELVRELEVKLTRIREYSPPPTMYQRTTSCSCSELEPSSRREERFVSSWEGVLEERDNDILEPVRIRVSVCTGDLS